MKSAGEDRPKVQNSIIVAGDDNAQQLEEARLKAAALQSEERRLEEARRKAEEEKDKLDAVKQVDQGDIQEQESVQIAFGAGLGELEKAHKDYGLSQRGEEDYKKFEGVAQSRYQSLTHQKDQGYFIIKDGDDEIKIPSSMTPGFKTNKPVPNLDPDELSKLNLHIKEKDYPIAIKRCGIDEGGNVVKDVSIQTFYKMDADGKFKCSEITLPPTATLKDGPELQLFTDWQGKQGEGEKKDLQTFLVEKHAEIDWGKIIITAPSKSRDGEMVNICTGQELGRIMRDMHTEIAPSLEQGHSAAIQKARIDENTLGQQHSQTPRSRQSEIILNSPRQVGEVIAQTPVVNNLPQSSLSPSSSIAVGRIKHTNSKSPL